MGGPSCPKPRKWQADIPLGRTWAYTPGVGCKPTDELVEIIVDNVSMNGLTMFSVAPKPDGSLPESQIRGLKELGKWMAINKPALYGTVPAPFAEGGTDDWECDEIRFTRKGGCYLYAIFLERPEAPVIIPGVYPLQGSEIKMLGSDRKLRWYFDQEEEELVIRDLPDPLPCNHAWSFEIRVLDEAW
jgi:alpha-L-fucosidase